MSVIWDIAALLSLIYFLSSLTEVINPDWLEKPFKEGTPPILRKQQLGIALLYLIVFLLFFGLADYEMQWAIISILAFIIVLGIAYDIYIGAQKRGLPSRGWFFTALFLPGISWIAYGIVMRFYPKDENKPTIRVFPGFRSKKLSKMIWATSAYLVLFLFYIAVPSPLPPSHFQPVRKIISTIKAEAPKEPSVIESVDPIYTLGLNPDEFVACFNENASKLTNDLQISTIKVTKGISSDSFSYRFNDHLGLISLINKQDSTLRKISMMGQGETSPESAKKMIQIMTLMIKSVNPNIDLTGCNKILEELGVLGQDDLSVLKGEIVLQGKRYNVSSSKEYGLLFSIKDSEDQ